MRIHMAMRSGELACLKAFYEHTTSFKSSAPCTICAAAHKFGGPYLQWACTHDEKGVLLPRCGSVAFQLSSTDADKLMRGNLRSVNWAGIGATFCKLTLFTTGSDVFIFPSTVGATAHVVDLYFPVFKRIFAALGFAPAVFDEFEAHIVTLLQNTLPGVWLTTLIDDAFNAFLDEKTNELAAFIAESSLSLAVFPGISDASARSSQIVAEAISTGDEALRMKNQLARLPHAPLATPPTTTPAPPSAPVATATNGATPGGGNLSQNRNQRKNSQAATPAASSTTAPAAAAPIAPPPGRAPRPGSCTQIVKQGQSQCKHWHCSAAVSQNTGVSVQ
jgi:hypothetical protein